jgi:hypothetical protein
LDHPKRRIRRTAGPTRKALAGYATAKSGRELVFAFMVNGVPIDMGIRSALGGR